MSLSITAENQDDNYVMAWSFTASGTVCAKKSKLAIGPGFHFSEAVITFRAQKAIIFFMFVMCVSKIQILLVLKTKQ